MYALILALLVAGFFVTCLFVYASSKVSHTIFEDTDDEPVVATDLPAARASGRVVVAPPAGRSLGVYTLPAPQSGAGRDKTVGMDQARTEARELYRQKQRGYTREVRK